MPPTIPGEGGVDPPATLTVEPAGRTGGEFTMTPDPVLASSDWSLFSWIYWSLWILAFFAYEIPAVYLEKKHGTLPLTRVVRDRLMRRITLFRLAGLLAVTWIWVHFVTPLDW